MLLNVCARLPRPLSTCSTAQIRRAYRTLCTRHHPDKGGDSKLFQQLQTAWSVLSDPAKRKSYDDTGAWTKSAGEEFVEQFSQVGCRFSALQPCRNTQACPADHDDHYFALHWRRVAMPSRSQSPLLTPTLQTRSSCTKFRPSQDLTPRASR